MVNFNCYKFFCLLILLGCIAHGTARAQILNSETIIRIEKGKKTTTRKLHIQVNNKEDNWLSKIEISHEPDEEFELIEARVIDRNGNNVRKIKKKDITTRSDISHGTYYQDGLVEEFSMYWSQYPYQIEYSYQVKTSEFFWIAYWNPVRYVNLASLKSSLKLEIPPDYGISMDYSEGLLFQDTYDEKRRILTWSSGPSKIPKPEIHGPPLREMIPYVMVTPKKFQYGVPGSSESWSSLGQWQMELNRGTDILPTSEKKVVQKLVAQSDDPKEKTEILYNYLQDKTHYINVDIDKGGMKSYPASYVSQNKYGDCKALTTYMKALLNSIGIESYYTLINGASNPIKVKTDFPSQQFNHAVLMVPLDGETIWLENTSNSTPFNYMGTFTQGRTALVIDSEKSRLVQTPSLGAADVADIRTYRFEANDDDTWAFSLSADIGGSLFENYLHYLKNVSSEDLKSALLRDFAGKGFELQDWDFDSSDSDNRHMDVTVQGSCNSQIREIGSLKVISPNRISIPEFEKPERRKSIVRINFPINRINVSEYEMSTSKVGGLQMSEAVDIKSKYGTYKVNYSVRGQIMSVQESFMLKAGEYALTEYKDFYDFIQRIKTHQKSINIIIQ